MGLSEDEREGDEVLRGQSHRITLDCSAAKRRKIQLELRESQCGKQAEMNGEKKKEEEGEEKREEGEKKEEEKKEEEKKEEEKKKESENHEVHLLPCKIHHTGPANVSSYFLIEADPVPPGESAPQEKVFRTLFRGKELKANKVKIPNGYEGVVVKEKKAPEEIEGRYFAGEESFDSMYLWGHDFTLDYSSPYLKAMDWLALADELHDTSTKG